MSDSEFSGFAGDGNYDEEGLSVCYYYYRPQNVFTDV